MTRASRVNGAPDANLKNGPGSLPWTARYADTAATGQRSFVSSQTSGLHSYNIISIAVPAFLCTSLFMLYLVNISYFCCRETKRALNAKGSEGVVAGGLGGEGVLSFLGG